MRRSEKQVAERHLATLRRMQEYREKMRTERGITNSFLRSEVEALKWALYKLSSDVAKQEEIRIKKDIICD